MKNTGNVEALRTLKSETGVVRSDASENIPLDFVLIDKLEDVRSTDQNSNCSSDGHSHEDVQLQSVDYHGDVAPVFQYLQIKCFTNN